MKRCPSCGIGNLVHRRELLDCGKQLPGLIGGDAARSRASGRSHRGAVAGALAARASAERAIRSVRQSADDMTSRRRTRRPDRRPTATGVSRVRVACCRRVT